MMHFLDQAAGAGDKPTKRMRMSAEEFHVPVLPAEVQEYLAAGPGKIFVDGTLGGGGHSEIFLRAGARVIGLDQDPAALAFAEKRLAPIAKNFCAMQANFVEVASVLQQLGIAQLDGALLDLGVSSWQLEAADRGFSFLREGPLDMRMNPAGPVTAADLVNHASGEALEHFFRAFGEEPAARRVALRLVQDRLQKPFVTTLDLARSVESVLPRRGKIHPATRIFQALRIAVNRELEVLPGALEEFTKALRPGGRLGVITFHSLEDRVVKAFFKQRSVEFFDRPEWPAPRPNPQFSLRLVTRKAVPASAAEQARNPRARSAKLRVAEKI